MAVSPQRLGLASLLLLSAAAAGCSDDAGSGSGGAGGTGSATTNPSGTSSTNPAGGGDDTASNGITVGNGGCTPITCEEAGATCGQISDGCNGTIECGTCDDGLSCQGDPPTCQQGGPCVPRTCEDAGANCGPIGDGCGGLIEDCGSCDQPETCGGDGPPATPNVCSIPASCTGLCLQQVTCDEPGVTTTISGIVYAPGRAGGPAPGQVGGPDPLFDALVYVPNGQVLPFEAGVQCSQCGEEASGDPLVSARTDDQGRFVLENVPVGEDIPLVIQLGRWRRQVTIPAVDACVDNPVTDWNLTRLPRNKSEGDIPKIAIATGAVDGLECVLRKIGIEDGEFTAPSGDGRVHLYQGAGAGGQRPPGNVGTTSETVLLDDMNRLDDYDMVLFPCQGASYGNRESDLRKSNIVDYTNAGGRIFATHYSYDWLHDNGPFATVGDWDVGTGSLSDQDGLINQTFPKGEVFANWLVHVGASTTLGRMPVKVVRQNIDSVDPNLATEWMSRENGDNPLHITFNTPVGEEPENQCGRALFSDFHIADDSGLGSRNFPSGCDGDQAVDVPMTPQEKLVEFMLFDLGSCLTPDVPPPCEPFTCEQLDLECGPAADGCNDIIQCGECDAPETCGGGGVPGHCGDGQCIPRTCEQLGKNCGMVSNGCGELMDCGDCTGNQTCGGGGTENVCGGGVPG
jgi:hypothetical protein